MRVLVTGHLGNVGRTVAAYLARLGHELRGFDRKEGDDLLDLARVRSAAAGCEAVVHLAALAHDSAGPPEAIMATNVLGTFHVLLAAEEAGVGHVVVFSSAQVLGIAEGEREPDYFPIDDDHPRRAVRPYGLSKRLCEDLCAAFTERTAVPTALLRPVAVWGPQRYLEVESSRAAAPESEWEPFWEFGAFVDVRDVARATEAALRVEEGHHRVLLCAADISASAPSLECVARIAPDVPVRDRRRFEKAPYASLVDCAAAEAVLGWTPRHRWSSRHSGRTGVG